MARLVNRRGLLGAGVLAGAGAAWTSLSSSWSARFLRDRLAEWGRDVPAGPAQTRTGHMGRQCDHGRVARARDGPRQLLRPAPHHRPDVVSAHRRGHRTWQLRAAAAGAVRADPGRAAGDRPRARLARALRPPRHAVAWGLRGNPAAVMAWATSDLLPSRTYSSVHELRWNESVRVRHRVGEKPWSDPSRSSTGARASGGTSTAATPGSSSSARGASC